MKYFSESVEDNLKNIYRHRFITFIANGFFGIFGLMFLYKILGEDIKNMAIFFASTSFGYIILMPMIKFLSSKIGFNRILFFGWLMNILIMVSYYFASENQNNFYGIILIGFFTILFRIFYWVPMHTELAQSSNKNDRTKTVAFLAVLSSVVGVFIPTISGFITVEYGFSTLFLIGIIISILALIPLWNIQDNKVKITWSLKKFWKTFFNPTDKKFALAIFSRGVETSVGIIVWPVFVYHLLEGDLLKVGILSSAITLFVIILNLVQGKIIDDKKIKKKFIKYGSFLYSIGWFLKIFGTTAFYIFIVDVYQRITSSFSFVSFDALVYDHIADKGHLIDEWTIIKEMILHAGKMIGFILIGILSIYINLNFLFIIAAVSVLIINIIPSNKKEELFAK